MQPGAAAEHEQQRKLSGRPWPKGTSGNPLGSAAFHHRAAELISAFVADFTAEVGRAPSAAEHAILRTAARFMARADNARDPEAATKLANSATRLRASLQTRRRREPAPVETFAEISRRVQEAHALTRAAELAADADEGDAAAAEAASP